MYKYGSVITFVCQQDSYKHLQTYAEPRTQDLFVGCGCCLERPWPHLPKCRENAVLRHMRSRFFLNQSPKNSRADMQISKSEEQKFLQFLYIFGKF